MVLRLAAQHLAAIQAHAVSTYPEECCGLLLGTLDAAGKTVVEVRPTENAWDAAVAEPDSPDASLDKSRRYWIAPEAMLLAMREGRSRQLTIVGIYHSHPDYPAVPSECDRQTAWQQYSYVIVSVQSGIALETQSWVLDQTEQFRSEPLLTPSFPDPDPSPPSSSVPSQKQPC